MINNILIKNASIYHTETSTFSSPKDIQVTDGKITRIEENIKAEKNWELVEGEKPMYFFWMDRLPHTSIGV